ncbi:Uncharacterised protein [Acinetobacter baumannii]|nr:Uncharacterised protein [Acinetobacter baumannii]SSS03968.1 Uncharacterised protein [Acinetobacter baumannii]
MSGAIVIRAARIFNVAIQAIMTPAPAAALYIPQKPLVSVLT